MFEALIAILLICVTGALAAVARELHGLALRAPNTTTFWVPPEAIDGIERAVERGLSKIAIPAANNTVNQVVLPDREAVEAYREPPRIAARQNTGYHPFGTTSPPYGTTAAWIGRPALSTAQIIEDRAVGGLETEIREAERRYASGG